MTNVEALRGGAVDAGPSGDEAAVLATEVLLNHPRARLLGETILAALCAFLAGGADWLAVFHLMSIKSTDALGVPIGSTAGLVAMSSVTVVAYIAIGVLAARPERWAKALALGLYLVVLTLLARAIAPAEIGGIRDLWAALGGGAGGFGAGAVADEAPSWFVIPCLLATTVAFSQFGIVFLIGKAWLSRAVALWDQRARATATLQQREAAQRRDAACRAQAEFIAALATPAVADTLIETVLRQSLSAYRAVLETEIDAAEDALSDCRLTKPQKQRLAVRLEAAQRCLTTASALTEEPQ